MASPTQSFGNREESDNREVIINIGLDAEGNITVEPEYFKVSKSKNQEVRWVCAMQHDHMKERPCFTVDFDKNGSPFYETQFSSDAPVSGLARRDVLPGPKIYDYTVQVGDKEVDPGGGVQQ